MSKRVEVLRGRGFADAEWVVFAAGSPVDFVTMMHLVVDGQRSGWGSGFGGTIEPLDRRVNFASGHNLGVPLVLVVARCAADVEALVAVTDRGEVAMPMSDAAQFGIRFAATALPANYSLVGVEER